MNTNDYSAYTVIGAIEVYWLLVLMLNGFLLKFIVKKNPAFPDKGRYVLSSDNETYLWAKSQTVSIVSTQKLKIDLPYDPAITVLGI